MRRYDIPCYGEDSACVQTYHNMCMTIITNHLPHVMMYYIVVHATETLEPPGMQNQHNTIITLALLVMSA